MITQEELKTIVHYNSETGIFTRLKKTGCKGTIGEELNRQSKGYKYLAINKRTYLQHRLVWLYMYGYIPEVIDHINHDGLDNRLCNLRPATKSTNGMNMVLPTDNKSGIKGIFYEKKANGYECYIGRIGVNKKYTIKRFSKDKYGSIEAALEAAKEWVAAVRASLHGEFAHNG